MFKNVERLTCILWIRDADHSRNKGRHSDCLNTRRAEVPVQFAEVEDSKQHHKQVCNDPQHVKHVVP